MLFKHYVGLSDVKREIIMVFLGMLLLATTAHAADAQNTDSCYANYFAEKGELIIPCVDVIDPSGMVQSYEVTLNQLSTTDGSLQFGLKEWQVSQSDIVAIQEGSSCRAVYSVEQGNLLMPCVNVVDSNGQAEAYQVEMARPNTNSVELPRWTMLTANSMGITTIDESNTRSARSSASSSVGYSSVCTSASGSNTYINGINIGCNNSNCSSSGATISCNSNSCKWCDASNKCSSILYNGVTSISGGSITCTNGRCKYSTTSGGGSFSCQSNQREITVSFSANDIGRVTSSPAGIDCTRGSCSAGFTIGSLVTLTATPLTKPETGVHFVGWNQKNCTMILVSGGVVPSDGGGGFRSCSNTFSTTAPSFTFKVPSKVSSYDNSIIEAVFKIERCFGAVGAGCGLAWDDSLKNKQYVGYGPDTDSDIAVGSIRHDNCCLNNPSGWACGFAEGASLADSVSPCNNAKRQCCTEWNKAVDNKLKGRTWLPKPSPFGPYLANQGTNLNGSQSNVRGYPELPATLLLKAPDGTKLDATDAAYCASGKFMETDATVKSQGFGTCGYRCGDTVVQGANAPETRIIELGKRAGKFQFDYQTFDIADKMVIKYNDYYYSYNPYGGQYLKNTLDLWDTGCVGTKGQTSKIIHYSGSSALAETRVRVEVTPNCTPGKKADTKWEFKVSCPK